MPIEISTPGSKSITNRVLTLAALTNKNQLTIKNAANCDDSDRMIECLNKLGLKIEQKNSTILIKGNIKKTNKTTELYTGHAGTTTRFLTALCTTLNRHVIIKGSKRMHERPINLLTEALNKLGAKIKNTNNCPPLEIFPQKLKGGQITINGNISSQYISALLMTTPFAEKDTNINIDQKLCSTPYVHMTIEIMKEFGIKIKNNNFEHFKITAKQNTTPPLQYTIESDCSSASYIGAFAALNPEIKIQLNNIFQNSLQGDIKFTNYLEKMGCKVKFNKKGVLIQGPKKLKSLKEIDFNKTPDLVMTFAVLAMFTKGKTKFTNIENLKIKETNRIKALKNEISKFGIKIKTGTDYIEIEGKPKLKKSKLINKKIPINTYKDHRMAMCFGTIKHIFKKLEIEKPNCVSKSYSTFWQDIDKLNKRL